MISKDLLDDIVAYEIHIKRDDTGGLSDVYTLRFRQWWRRKMVLRYARIISNIDPSTELMTHTESKESKTLNTILADHMASKHVHHYDEPAKVIKLIIDNDK